MSEVFVRVNEFRERLAMGCLGFGEVVELVYVLNRLDRCKEILVMVVITEKQRLKVSNSKTYPLKNEERTKNG